MNVKILEQKQEPLLSRTVITADLTFEGATPSKEEVKKVIASQTKADEKLLIIKKITTRYGSTKAQASAYLYDSEEEMKKIEPKDKKAEAAAKKKAEEAKKAAGEQPAAPEAPKQEKKEKHKPEEKKEEPKGAKEEKKEDKKE